MSFVILAAGSTTWTNGGAVAQALLQEWSEAGRPEEVIVVIDSRPGVGHIVEQAFANGEKGFQLEVRDNPSVLPVMRVDVALLFISTPDRDVERLRRRLLSQPIKVVTYREEVRPAPKTKGRHKK